MNRDRVKILLVDDRPENLIALEAILASLDEDLVRATSGEEALKRLLTDEFAVILLDVQMPGLDGYETAEHIKRRERTRDVPIIFLTANQNEPNNAFRGYAAGAVDYLSKPFDPWVLRAKVAVFVDLHRKNRRLRAQAELLERQLRSQASDASGETLVEVLSARLGAVEDQVQLLEEQAKVTVDSAMADAVVALSDRVGRLRGALDSMTARP